MKASTGGAVDRTKPLDLQPPESRVQGRRRERHMIDFWLSNAKLQGDGGEYRVRYSVDGGAPKFIDKWAPVWLSG